MEEATDLNQNNFQKRTAQPPPPTKFLGIEFAPLHIPFRRRLETLVVFFAVIEFILGYLAVLFLAYVFFTSYWYLALAYSAWLYIDRDTPRRGTRDIVPRISAC